MKIPEIHKTFGAIAVRLFTSACMLAILLAGCADVLASYRQQATKWRWQESVIQTAHFRHRVWRSGDIEQARFVHIYIEGDGAAWRTPSSPSSDPTPREALMFRLMALDPIPSIYVGRPCYFETEDRRCDVRWWTFQRYGSDVVDSMVQALRIALGKTNVDTRLTLIGHSGGGALAIFMAPRLPNVNAVITLAGNLDTQAWASLHGYAPLVGSDNPAASAALASNIVQRHFVAASDDVVPASIIKRFCDRNADGTRDIACPVVAGTTHTTGWESKWQALLAALPAVVGQP